MVEGLIDLHVHTTASDGTLTPTELVRYAKSKNLVAVAITDHDTIEGIEEAIEIAHKEDLEIVPGVEISVDYHKKEMHILGYFIDIQDKVINKTLSELCNYREQRNPKIVTKLKELGMDVSMDEVIAKAGGSVVGRPHFAAVMVEKGYVSSIGEAFEKFLAAGKPAYVKKEKLSPEQGIGLIRNAGGIPVLAHPKYLLGESHLLFEEMIKSLERQGLQGIEAYYSTHSREETQFFVKIAQEKGLIITGGTDFHGDNKPEFEIGIGHGDLRIPYSVLEELKALLKRQRK